MKGVHHVCCTACRDEIAAPDYVGEHFCRCRAIGWRRLDALHIEFFWRPPFYFYRTATWHPEQYDARGNEMGISGWW